MDHPGFGIHLEDGRKTEFILIGPEGANAVRQLLGQHGNYPVDQVDRSTPLEGFLLEE